MSYTWVLPYTLYNRLQVLAAHPPRTQAFHNRETPSRIKKKNNVINLREPQHTPGAYPRPPQTPK